MQRSGVRLGCRDVGIKLWHSIEGMAFVGGLRLDSSCWCLGSAMSNVCHSFGLQGTPLQATGTHNLHCCWVSGPKITSSTWHYKAVSAEFGVNSLWSRFDLDWENTWYRHYSVCPNRKLCPGCSCCEAFCMQCTLVNSNKLLIQSSTGNSILRIYWWFQIWLRNLAQATTN